MPDYTLYRVEEPPSRRPSARRRWLWLVPALVAAGALAFALVVLAPHIQRSFSDLEATSSFFESIGRLPLAVRLAVPLAALLVLLAVPVYLVFGRHRVLKALALTVVVVMAVAPGLAIGWTDKTLGAVESNDPEMVKAVRQQLDVALPKQPVNILLIGSDMPPGQPGRSDTLLIVRLDPDSKRISMLSVPRDLRVEIPGYGLNKINSAYTYGGAALAVKTVKQVTGLPINHYMQTYFGGFWHIVNNLGGVYMMVDHFYYNPVGSGYKSIDIQPGYQLLDGKNALNFVRYRHDIYADFGRMVRQQMFLKELQRQSMRWHNVLKLPRLIKAIVALTSSDISSMKQFLSMVSLVLQLNTAHIYNTHITGSTPMIDGVSYVVSTPEQIQEAVQEFENPEQPAAIARPNKIARKAYQVRVMSSDGTPVGAATQAAGQLAALGFDAVANGNAGGFDQASTVIWAGPGMSAAADQLATLFDPVEVQDVPRGPGVQDGITIILGSSYAGSLVGPQGTGAQMEQIVYHSPQNVADWRAAQAKLRFQVQMPTAWANGFTYQQFRTYTIPTGSGHAPALVAVGQTNKAGAYWDIQEMRWSNPPATANPSQVQTIGGHQYMLFYDGKQLHMVAWKSGGVVYWVDNTLDDALSNDFMLAVATSFKPVK